MADLGTINAAAVTLMAACLLAIRLLDAALDARAARAERTRKDQQP